MKCHSCALDNVDSALFCSGCRRPLVAPSKLPPRLEPLAVPAGAGVPVGSADASSSNRYAAPTAGSASRAGADPDALTQEEVWGAVIGDSNTHYYLTRFEGIANGERGGWHWPGFLVTWYWLLYRKMWIPALIYFFAPYAGAVALGTIAAISPVIGVVLVFAWIALWLIGPGMFANKWYYNHCMNKIRDVRSRGGSKEQMVARLEAAGGTSNILVIVLAFFGIFFVVGILAAVALPAYQTYTVKAKVSEAVLVGADVAQAVGRQYEQTGALPGDVEHLVSEAPHHSRFVSGVEMDSHSGTITVKIDAGGRFQGSVQMVPNADASRHITWTCTTEDLKRFVPAACRGGASR